MAATYQYELQVSELVGGKMKAILWSEFPDLVVPSFASLLLTQSTKEAMDELAPSLIELQDMVLDYVEDTEHSYYAARPPAAEVPGEIIVGFWAKVLTGDAEIQLQLDDGEGFAHYFWGIITPQTVKEDELVLTPDNEIRTGAFKCVSVLQRLKNFTIAQLRTAVATIESTMEVYDVGVYDGLSAPFHDNEFQAVKLHQIIGQMVNLAFSQSDLVANVPIPTCGEGNYQGPFLFRAGYWIAYDFGLNRALVVEEVAEAKFEDLWILLKRNDDDLAVSFFETNDNPDIGYVGTTSAPVGQSWPDRFGSCYDLLKGIVSQFGLIPRHHYDVATNTHKIYLNDRGFSYAEELEFPEPITSSRMRNTDVVANVTTARRVQFAQDVQVPSYSMVRGHGVPDEPPAFEAPQVSIPLEFFPMYGKGRNDIIGGEVWWQETTGHRPLAAEKLYYYATLEDDHPTTPVSRTGLHRIAGGYYYNPDLDVYDPATQNDSNSAEIAAKYTYFRQGNRGRMSYVREYPSLKAYDGTTNTHSNIFPGKRTVIDTGEGEKTFYATSVEKNAFTGKMIVRWRQL